MPAPLLRPTKVMPDGTPAYSAPQAAQILGIGKNTVRRRVEAGLLHGAVVEAPGGSRQFVVSAASVRALLAEVVPETLELTAPASRSVDDTVHLLELAQLRSAVVSAEARLEVAVVRLSAAESKVAELEVELHRVRRALRRQAVNHAEVVSALADED